MTKTTDTPKLNVGIYARVSTDKQDNSNQLEQLREFAAKQEWAITVEYVNTVTGSGLADELWGEIDHKLNYPRKHKSSACREEILALARVTSGCSRLVDAIMTTHQEWERGQLRNDQEQQSQAIAQNSDTAIPPQAAKPSPEPSNPERAQD